MKPTETWAVFNGIVTGYVNETACARSCTRENITAAMEETP